MSRGGTTSTTGDVQSFMKRQLSHFYQNKAPATVDLGPGSGEYPPVPLPEGDTDTCIPIDGIDDIAGARHAGQALAQQLGLTVTQMTVVATAISELASNILLYAGRGEIVLQRAVKPGRVGITVTARDEGPGVPDLAHALAHGCSTSGGPGLGLPGIKHLMDEFDIDSSPRGTTVTTTLWR